MFIRDVEILGTPYIVKCGSREEIGLSVENDGECRIYSKEILVFDDKSLSEEERSVKLQEVFAHEFLHAYFNEAGVDLEPQVEENIACFFMKNWRKLSGKTR